MSTLMSPGVHVQIKSGGAKPIEGVGTRTAAFIGATPKDVNRDTPVPCNNWTQFCNAFVDEDSAGNDLARAVHGFFLNGGGRCYIVNTGVGSPIAGDARKRGSGLRCLEAIEEIAMVAAPGCYKLADCEALLAHCEKCEDRFAILDSDPEAIENPARLTEVATAAATEAGGGDEDSTKRSRKPAPSKGLCPPRSKYGALYFPWLMCRDVCGTGDICKVPPSGHMAGIYARCDASRGVHKAPANETIRGALGLDCMVTPDEQAELNSAGVNVMRFFPDLGIRPWGARTLSSDPEWRYINVMRLFIMIRGSLLAGTGWCVFEPNDRLLWNALKRDIGAYLTLLWRSGALMGATPEEAFFVKCDEETNPKEVIDAGQIVTQIGVAPVKPAEFVIFQLRQWEGGSEVNAQQSQTKGG